MVQILTILGAAALLSQSALSIPLARRSSHEVQQPEEQNEYGYNNQYGNQYDNQYDNQYEPPAEDQQQEHETSTVEEHETSTVDEQQMEHETSTVDEQQMEHETSTVDEQQMEHETTSTAMAHETSTVDEQQMEHETSTAVMHDTTAEAEETTVAHETTSAAYAYPTYGSGSSEWGNNYQDCVSQCVNQYGAPPAEYNPPAAEAPAEGNVHTVLVAPDGAGLKYMPFALNATVGDTIRYVWTTPQNHTATLSSALALCNRSAEAEARSFVSGVRNAAVEMQIFDVVVETEEPQFFYCSVAEHCQKGMFGIINPASSFGGDNTVGAKMNEWVEANPDLQAAWEYISQSTRGTSADTWGSNIDLTDIPEDAYPQVAANIMFSRANFAANPGMLELNQGATTPDGSPVQIVSDLNTLLSNASPDPNSNPAAPSGSVTGEAPEPSDLVNSVVDGQSAASRTTVGMSVAALVGVVSWMLV